MNDYLGQTELLEDTLRKKICFKTMRDPEIFANIFEYNKLFN